MHASEQTRMTRQHIFAVNTSPDVLDVMRQLLQDERYNVTTTNFVPETFDQITALTPALLLIDVAVGEAAGWALLERLRADAVTRDIPTIVMSTNRDLLDDVQADPARFGRHRVLRKPFNLDDLLQMVDELIGPA